MLRGSRWRWREEIREEIDRLTRGLTLSRSSHAFQWYTWVQCVGCHVCVCMCAFVCVSFSQLHLHLPRQRRQCSHSFRNLFLTSLRCGSEKQRAHYSQGEWSSEREKEKQGRREAACFIDETLALVPSLTRSFAFAFPTFLLLLQTRVLSPHV